jgi:hypothetical protein
MYLRLGARVVIRREEPYGSAPGAAESFNALAFAPVLRCLCLAQRQMGWPTP